jgi:hypothetical protein
MTLRLALRSLLTRPVRSAVLACGFGFGISVMAALLGVGEVILEQSVAPALVGGGDVVLTGWTGSVSSARHLTSSILMAPPLASRVVVASPTLHGELHLLADGAAGTRITARGGILALAFAGLSAAIAFTLLLAVELLTWRRGRRAGA